MGGIDFKLYARGKNINEAYKDACEEAEVEYGNDGYNGSISTTAYLQDVTKEFKNGRKSLNEFIESKLENLGKRCCLAVCIEEPVQNTNKIKTQVEHIVTSGTKKWVLKYVVNGDDGELGAYDTKGAAVEKARKYTEVYQCPTTITMEKRLEKASPVVAKITYKKDTKEKLGKWVLFGVAAC